MENKSHFIPVTVKGFEDFNSIPVVVELCSQINAIIIRYYLKNIINFYQKEWSKICHLHEEVQSSLRDIKMKYPTQFDVIFINTRIVFKKINLSNLAKDWTVCWLSEASIKNTSTVLLNKLINQSIGVIHKLIRKTLNVSDKNDKYIIELASKAIKNAKLEFVGFSNQFAAEFHLDASALGRCLVDIANIDPLVSLEITEQEQDIINTGQ